ncbi:MAG: hypothetical protein FWF54_01615 [Candidatus Azobacteroides sp.]|nr:hypothetical protein [Candidatus Azobacteroides sp.]
MNTVRTITDISFFFGKYKETHPNATLDEFYGFLQNPANPAERNSLFMSAKRKYSVIGSITIETISI